MHENSEEVNDSTSASSTSNLSELPKYILRNLTPAKKSNSKDENHRVRKQRINQTKTLKLKKRSQVINRRIQKLKLQQEIISDKIAEDLSENLRLANERRMAFLEKKREKARNIQLTSFKLPIVLSSYVKSNTSAYNGIEYINRDIQSIIKIQRIIKKYVLFRNITKFRSSQFLPRLKRLSYTETLMLLSPLTEFTKIMISILRNLGLPDILPQQKYKSFLYSLVLIADYKESLIHHTQSGFNTNISDKNINNLANSISLLLFKLAQSVLNKFIDFVNCDPTEVTDPWSVSKLKLCKSWKVYHFFFQIFRTLHFNNCVVIINDALEIAQKQLLVCLDTEIETQRNNYAKNHKFLTKLSEVFKFSGTEWTYFGEDSDDFLKNVKQQVFNRVIPEKPKIRASLEVLEELENKTKNLSNHSIMLGHFVFYVPPKIPINKWRQYWIIQYRAQKRITINQYGIPINLKSGFFNLTNRTRLSNTYIEDVFKDLDMTSIHDKYEGLLHEGDISKFLTKFEYIICDIFLILFEYCISFEDLNDNEGFDIVMSQFIALKNSYQISNYNNHKELLQYFKLHFFCLSHLASIGPFILNFVPDVCNEFIDTLNNLSNVSICEFENVVIFYKEIEILIMDLWLKKCKRENIESIKQFENVCQFISKKNFKIENGTNSPHLRFPLFYDFLSKYDHDFDRHMRRYQSIICSTFEYPNFETFTINESSFRYFQQVFINYVLHNLKNFHKRYDRDDKVNEFYEFFKEINTINTKIYLIIISNCVHHLILNFCSNIGICISGNLSQIVKGNSRLIIANSIIEYFSENIDPPNIDTFISNVIRMHYSKEDNPKLQIDRLLHYIHREYKKITEHDESLLMCTLISKFEKLMRTDPYSTEFESLLTGNFECFIPQTRLVLVEINEIISEIYDLYSPLLNWIYKDIGEPIT